MKMEFNYALNLCQNYNDHDQILRYRHEDRRIQRSKTREMFLLKMFSVREILKWKYNYFETNPHEHYLFRHCPMKFKALRHTFKFKKLWRLKMDQLFYNETTKASRILVSQELKKVETSPRPAATVTDPSRLLVNYDREVVNMIRQVKNEFNSYLKFPKLYPNYLREKQKFLIQRCADFSIDSVDGMMDISVDIGKEFQFYWESRISTLCDMKVAEEKRIIRENWKRLLPVYYSSGDGVSCPEELQGLLLNDSDADDFMNYNED